MSGVTADSEKPSGTRHIWCRPRVGTSIALCRFCAKSRPGQWSGLPRGDHRPRKEAVAVQILIGEVEQRSLDVYELVAGGVA